ncbi:MAG: hypothetical protein ACOYT4_00540 [Nanoarchaeota archaeon]
MENLEQIEQNALNLLDFKLEGNVKALSHMSAESFELALDFLLGKKYLIQRGQTAKSLRYEITLEEVDYHSRNFKQ